jgi:protein-L-isoaspartate(D-aspartate) O-methyltransferase
MDTETTRRARRDLVRALRAHGIGNREVLNAMAAVARHELVPAPDRRNAYADAPLPIGDGQTISQPFIVALMTEMLRPAEGDRVLEVGTGSGYQAAVLATLGCEVFSIERLTGLAGRASRDLERLGYAVNLRVGDGSAGWPESAPFDAIIVTAASKTIPPALLAQLRPGGRMVMPVGDPLGVQRLVLVEKDMSGKVSQLPTTAVRFVPLVASR